MLWASGAPPQVIVGGSAKADSAIPSKRAGVRSVELIPAGVAVIADRYWSAKLGRDKLKIKWEDGENAGLSTSVMTEEFSKTSAAPGNVARKNGDPQGALSSAAKTITAEYDL